MVTARPIVSTRGCETLCCNIGGAPTCKFGDGLEGDMEDPRPCSRIGETHESRRLEATVVRRGRWRERTMARGQKQKRASEPEGELTAQQARIRRLVGRAREKARERKKEKGKLGRFAWSSARPDAAIFIRKARRYGTRTRVWYCRRQRGVVNEDWQCSKQRKIILSGRGVHDVGREGDEGKMKT